MGAGRAITVAGTIYHRAGPQAQATAINLRWTRELESDEQPWGPRQFTVTEQWTPLDCGWLKPELCGMLVIENREGHFTQRIPTEEQRAEAMARVVEIGVTNARALEHYDDHIIAILEVRPKESQPLMPVDVSSLRIRCRKGEARCVLTVLPR